MEDHERDLQELTFAVIVARDIALARAQLEPDLLLSALSAGQPEIRCRRPRAGSAVGRRRPGTMGLELIGPRQPEKASDMRNCRNRRNGRACSTLWSMPWPAIPSTALRRRPGARPASATGSLLARGETP
ncbi:MAG: hypothetical protein R3F40_10375 [Candidatus Competibacteraceae bacterium]